MITVELWPSLSHPGQWCWAVYGDLPDDHVTRGRSADEWLARANIRIHAKHYAEQEPTA